MNPDDLLIDPDFDSMGTWLRNGQTGQRDSTRRDTDKGKAMLTRRRVRRGKLAGRFAWMESSQ